MKILICGLPGSGKSTLADTLSEIVGAVWINADEVREHYDDWDFTPEGRERQAQRMRYLSDGAILSKRIVIADFVAPTAALRKQYDPDYIIWMDTINEGRYEDTNAMFEKVENADYICKTWNTTANILGIIEHIKSSISTTEGYFENE
jgi:adenylylsulfate kinase